MRIKLDVSLDPTLGCGQAHRWRKEGDSWVGVLGKEVVRIEQGEGHIDVYGCESKCRIESYFRSDDDLDEITDYIASKDPYVANLSGHCPGLRILRQPQWECLATYLLATNANVKRIGSMVESVCRTFGKEIEPGKYTFPEPSNILDNSELITECRLGFRESRFVELAENVESGMIDIDAIAECDYEGTVKKLQEIKGVGPKVADCVALFAFDHLEAFPVDTRIAHVMKRRFGITGSYKTVSEFGMNLFGKYAGYAQEYLYHSEFIE